MFSPELAHGFIELAGISDILAGAFALEMDDRGTGEVIIHISGLFEPIAQIDIFRVHKEGRIEGAYFIQNGPAHPKTSSRQYRRRMGAGFGQKTEIIC